MKSFLQSKWEEILEYVKVEFDVNEVSCKIWLHPLKIADVSENTVIIVVDTSKIGAANLNFIRTKYGIFIKTAIAEIISREKQINLSNSNRKDILNDDFEIEFISNSEIEEHNKKKVIKTETTKGNDILSLNSRYTFENFVVSSNNNLAHAAALAVAESPAEVYNPLYIYGGVGLGKTHLMQSIAQYILKSTPGFKIRYVQSEKFTNELIEAIRHGTNTPPEFREKYRNVDILLIDDIQFIIGKERTQEEFFHTFNTLYDAKKQIVISSDKPPKDLVTLEERLRSRFEWGLIVDMQFPDFETRMAILQKKNDLDGYYVDDEILRYIAVNIKSNIRELEGSLTKIIAMSRLQKKEINMSLAEEALKDIISVDASKIVSPELIVNIVAEHFSITSMEINSNKRSRDLVVPRQIAMFLCRKLTATSLKDIGNMMGKRDHSTVLHGYNKIEDDLTKDASLKNTIDILIKKINPQP